MSDQTDISGALMWILSSGRHLMGISKHPSAIDDYGYGLIHLAWYLADQGRFLMFGLVELYPVEFPAPLDTPEKYLALKRSWQEESPLCETNLHASEGCA